MIGEVLAVGSSIAFGAGSVFIAKGARHGSVEGGVLLCAIATAAISLVAWPFAGVVQGLADDFRVTWAAIGWFAASGALASIGARLTMYRSIQMAGVIRASTARRLLPFISLFLGWAIFDERIGAPAGLGMLLVGLSFALLLWDNRAAVKISEGEASARTIIYHGLLFGVASSMLHALSYAARKFGLLESPDAFLGAFVGALTAIAFFAGSAAMRPNFRRIAVVTLTKPDPSMLIAAILISTGQIAQFAALSYIGIGRLAFLNAIEAYAAALLAVFVFRTEPMPRTAVLLAMVIATLGIALIAVPSR